MGPREDINTSQIIDPNNKWDYIVDRWYWQVSYMGTH